jgi:predicted phosphoadenosine phosphosulfate sulfurtransferase
MFETHWRPWDPEKRDIWVRELPEKHLGLADLPWITPEMTDYEFQEEFARQHHLSEGAKRTAVLVGIRAQESLDRWRTIVSDRNKVGKFLGTRWTTKVGDNVYNCYPIYDWQTEDIWTANARFGWSYNRLYDLFQLAGLPLKAMRVSSPFHGYAKSSLALYRTIDPLVWGRMVSRVNGVNFTAMYGATKAMGWKNIEKPAHFTWQQYAEFLLATLPPAVAENYRQKLAVSIKSWQRGGGVMDEKTIAELEAEGAEFVIGEPGKRSATKRPVTMGYLDDTTVTDFTRIPTWKRFCITILKNDHVGKYMGFTLTKYC